MAKNIYVGNLPWKVQDDELREMFLQHGAVRRAQVIKDRDTGRSRGFGFVEMDDDGEAQRAIDALNGADIEGRPLTVNEAKQREERGGGGRSGGYGGRSGGGRTGGGYAGGTNRGRMY
jgi:RNA recognition motif-containing protein